VPATRAGCAPRRPADGHGSDTDLLCIFESASIVALACFRGAAIRPKDKVAGVLVEGLREELDGLVVVFCREGLVALGLEFVYRSHEETPGKVYGTWSGLIGKRSGCYIEIGSCRQRENSRAFEN
jgi:hypothetical protein